MFSAIRKRITYTNVALTLALVFAMSGGAYAAGRYVITSTKQISPKVLKSLQGKAGKAGASGAAGSQGPAGPAGPQGSAGAAGGEGKAGKEGPTGKNGENGKEGSPWTAGGTLPSGQTETGAWAFSPSTSILLLASLSFPIRLAQPLSEAQVHYVGLGGQTTECPGTPAEPKAAKGNLCVYETLTSGLEKASLQPEAPAAVQIYPASGKPKEPFGGELGADTGGAELAVKLEEGASGLGWGSWAVTAE